MCCCDISLLVLSSYFACLSSRVLCVGGGGGGFDLPMDLFLPLLLLLLRCLVSVDLFLDVERPLCIVRG